jgi:hypothetical protein
MRKIFVGFTAACVLLAGVLSASAAAPANFAGTWALDKVKSEGLTPQTAAVVSLTLTVTQDAQQIAVESKAEMPPSAAAGGPGPGVGTPPGVGRGRGMGIGAFPQNASYKLDGTETTADNPGGRGTTTFKAVWKDGGKTLELTRVLKANFGGNDVTITTTEDWSLSADGKTLTIKRTNESPRGTQSSTLVFNKQ